MADDPATEILEATYRALCEKGYADLTLRDIAAEADRSKASLYYHYDSKDQLFVAFLDELYERFTDRVGSPDGETPREQLESLLDVLLRTDAGPSPRAFRTAMLELTAQAPYNPRLQARLAEFDEFLFDQLQSVLSAGVKSGQFDERIEPARDAEFITTAIIGAHTRHVAINRPPDRLCATMTGYIERHLLADQRPEVAQ